MARRMRKRPGRISRARGKGRIASASGVGIGIGIESGLPSIPIPIPIPTPRGLLDNALVCGGHSSTVTRFSTPRQPSTCARNVAADEGIRRHGMAVFVPCAGRPHEASGEVDGQSFATAAHHRPDCVSCGLDWRMAFASRPPPSTRRIQVDGSGMVVNWKLAPKVVGERGSRKPVLTVSGASGSSGQKCGCGCRPLPPCPRTRPSGPSRP